MLGDVTTIRAKYRDASEVGMVYHHASVQLLLGSKGPRTTLNMLDQLTELLAGTFLADRPIAVVDVLDTGQTAFAIEIAGAEVEQAWTFARENLNETGRWPVVSTLWRAEGKSWQERVQAEDFFSRFYFEEAPNADDVSPLGLIAVAGQCDPHPMLAELWQERDEEESLEGALDYQLDDTLHRYGNAPTREEIATAILHGAPLQTCSQLEEWLFQWERQQEGTGKPDEARQPWFEQDPSVLLLLPTAHSWETLAYINWYGTSDYGAQYYIALVQSWAEQYGAELVTHYGTMLQFLVANPPSTPEQAWELANQHDLAAPCTLALPGIGVRHYALGLVNCDRWFLHERP